ncbi:unnamed protein product [Coffea canephora]|uniref:Uncharacterized protein n=1 Tax=Coffea canephora TaxID=49390 RepID=A0A068UPZ9_COFCA|nr:unnamed protein product [Coffea canephora]
MNIRYAYRRSGVQPLPSTKLSAPHGQFGWSQQASLGAGVQCPQGSESCNYRVRGDGASPSWSEWD